MPVVLSPEALADLRHIRDYIALHNPSAASRVAVQLVAACDRLAFLPNRGRPGRAPGTRELVTVRPYVIVYRVTPGAVEIVRIWHMAQSRT
jgi:addiction module RelE/StbE family toxin